MVHKVTALKHVLLLSVLGGVAGCSHTQDKPEATTAPAAFSEDPFERANRASFALSNVLDALLVTPVRVVYTFVIPKGVRQRVPLFLDNIRTPVSFVNCLLQGRVQDAGKVLSRFLINTPLGFFGFFDTAQKLGISKPTYTDFSGTLRAWGSRPGPYLFWPLLGPSCGRDSFGMVMDFLMDPLALWSINHWPEINHERAGLRLIDTKQAYNAELERIQETSVDPYATIRSVYMQKSRK